MPPAVIHNDMQPFDGEEFAGIVLQIGCDGIDVPFLEVPERHGPDVHDDLLIPPPHPGQNVVDRPARSLFGEQGPGNLLCVSLIHRPRRGWSIRPGEGGAPSPPQVVPRLRHQ